MYTELFARKAEEVHRGWNLNDDMDEEAQIIQHHETLVASATYSYVLEGRCGLIAGIVGESQVPGNNRCHAKLACTTNTVKGELVSWMPKNTPGANRCTLGTLACSNERGLHYITSDKHYHHYPPYGTYNHFRSDELLRTL
jgi:hypothetical protein